ncbi:MAG: MarR family transcriptional regulator [Gemmatimonadaceae bacterium]
MSTPPLPQGLARTRRNRLANELHSLSIHVLRQARQADTEIGLSPQRLSVLSVLAFGGAKSIGDLATIEQVSRPAISTLVSALEDAGLARRERVSEDARTVIVHATADGMKLMERGRRGRLEIVSKRLTKLTREDLDTVARALRLLE